MELKTIWIKLLIFGILNSWGLYSCGGMTEYATYENYTYVNKSDHGISIEKWLSGVKKTIHLPSLDSIQQENELFSGSSDELISAADSVYITFDNEKILFLKQSTSIEVNILNINNYSYFYKGSTHYYSYIFTEKDYDKAE